MQTFAFTREEVTDRDFVRFERNFGETLLSSPSALADSLFTVVFDYSGFTGVFSSDQAFHEFAQALRKRFPYLCFLCDPDHISYYLIIAAALPWVEVINRADNRESVLVGVNHQDLAVALQEDVKVFREVSARAGIGHEQTEENALYFARRMFGDRNA